MKNYRKILIFNLSFICLFPFLLVLIYSFMPEWQVALKTIELSPKPVTLAQYYRLLSSHSIYFKYYFNTVVITVLIIAGQVFISTGAGYCLSKEKMKSKKKVMIIYGLTLLLPIQILLIPNLITFQWFRDVLGINFFNTKWSLILPNMFSAVGVLIMKYYIDKIPDEIVEASRLDGANGWTIFIRMIIPNAKPGIILVSIYYFIESWGSIESVLLFIDDYTQYPVAVLLTVLQSADDYYAASVLYVFPVIAVIYWVHSKNVLNWLKGESS